MYSEGRGFKSRLVAHFFEAFECLLVCLIHENIEIDSQVPSCQLCGLRFPASDIPGCAVLLWLLCATFYGNETLR